LTESFSTLSESWLISAEDMIGLKWGILNEFLMDFSIL
jgi:hypothetical protein